MLALVGKSRNMPEMAEVNATIVQDDGFQSRNLYQAVNNCSNVTGPCVITFPTVPAGKRLVIEHVSVAAVMSDCNALHMVLRGGSAFQFLPSVAAPGAYSGEFEYTVNESVFAIYDAGQAPNLDALVATSSPFTVGAFISGYTIDIP